MIFPIYKIFLNISSCEINNNLPIYGIKELKVSKNVDNLPIWWKTFWHFAAFVLISQRTPQNKSNMNTERPLILISNDDGYKARGINFVAELLSTFADVVVMAPEGGRSGMGWAMQIHFSCFRNPNTKMFSTLGPDHGFDCIAVTDSSAALHKVMDALYKDDLLPKTIVYSLNPADDQWLDTLIGAYQGTEVPGKIQHGSAWWFNDNKTGMQDQMISLGNLGILGNFVGMLTDSRSFLSYPRHDYFRRILCDLVGQWVENGEYPNNEESLKKIIEGVSCRNAVRYFGL